MRRLSARRLWACVYLAMFVTAASAQGGADSVLAALSLEEALVRTVSANPGLVAFGYQIDAAEGRLRQAQIPPGPELDAALQDVLGTNTHRGVRSAEATVSIAWVLERGVRERRVSAARAGVALRTIDAEIARLDVAAETARRFLGCLAFQERLSNAIEAVRLAEETVAAVRARVEAGSALEAELARAEAGLARAALDQEHDEHELLSAYHRLSAQWGDTVPDFSSVKGDVTALPGIEPFEALLARADGNPELARYMSRQRLAEAELRVAEARSRPDWRASAGLRRVEATDEFVLVGTIAIPLRTSGRNLGHVAEARADIARTEAEAVATRIDLETALFVLHQEFNHNLQLAAGLRDEVIPRLERALTDTRRAYELGRYGYFEWSVVQGELLQANSDLLEASVAAHQVVIEIERLTGVQAALPPAPQRGVP
ncbi:TolC family protein [Candidatus Rariloculus sp.]|uniref:TolC family protein n=1 Tax=Candidatus Rariloculus sp. TaxID=3101265 RepID=UPI003D11CC98